MIKNEGRTEPEQELGCIFYLVGNREPLKVFGESNVTRAAFCKDYTGNDEL